MGWGASPGQLVYNSLGGSLLLPHAPAPARSLTLAFPFAPARARSLAPASLTLTLAVALLAPLPPRAPLARDHDRDPLSPAVLAAM